MGTLVANYNTERQYQGYLGDKPKKPIQKFMVIEDRAHEVHNVVVHKFNMGDVEDPILYAGQPLWEWQESEQGKWVMEHALETPMWHRHQEPMNWGHVFAITAKLKAKDYSYFLLKWGNEGTRK